MLKNKAKTPDPNRVLQQIQETMTVEPIPKSLLVPDIMNYIVIFDPPSEKIFMDPYYILEKLYSQWIFFMSKAPELIAGLEEQEASLAHFFKKNPNDGKTKLKYRLHDGNREIARNFILVHKIYHEVRINLVSTRSAIVGQRLHILKSLVNLCQELMEHPRYVHFKTYSILQDWKIIETDMMPVTFMKYHALKNRLSDFEQQLKMMPTLFTKEAQNIEMVKHIVTTCMLNTDRPSGYIPEIEECNTIGLFLKSKHSPINIKDEVLFKLKPEQVPPLIEKVTSKLCEFIGLKSDKTEEVRGLMSLVTRFLFNEYLLIDSIDIQNPIFAEKVSKMKDKTLGELGFIGKTIPQEYESKTCQELINGSQSLLYALDVTKMIGFLTTPMDIAYYCYIISHSLSVAICEMTKTEVDYTSSFDDMKTMWAVLLIAAQDVCAANAISSIQKWDSIEAVSPIHKNSTLIPRAVILSYSFTA